MANSEINCISGNQVKMSPVNAESINENKKEPTKTSRIFLATIAANLSAFAMGTCYSWSSPVGPKLTSHGASDSPLNEPITMSEMAWISSIHTFGAITSGFIAGYMADKIGRKKALLFGSIFYIAGFIFLLTGKVLWVLLAARIILGFGIGFTMSIIPMYVGEISTDRTRGATISLMSFSMSIGLFYVYCIGPYVSYMALQYFCLLVPIVFDIAFFFMPESPYYFVAKGQREAASKSLQFLRSEDSQAVEAELISIEYFVTKSMTEKSSVFEIVKTSSSRKALLISIGLFFIQQTSGMNAVVFYTQTIFESARVDLDAAIAAIIVGFVQLTVSGIAPIVVKMFGRKIILLYAAVFMSISQAAFGYFFYSQIVLDTTYGITWVPITSMVLYNIAFGIGFGPVPWAILSEIFAQSTKAVAAATATLVTLLTGFAVLLLYPNLDALGAYYAFWLFAIFCVLGFFFVLFFVVETKNLSFAEIQTKFNKNS